MIAYAKGNITKFDVDAIVNAANGFGYMGGKRCVTELHSCLLYTSPSPRDCS